MDKLYWNQFYKEKKGVLERSDFAEFVLEYFKGKSYICGSQSNVTKSQNKTEHN